MKPDFEVFDSAFEEAVFVLVKVVFDIVSMNASKRDLMLDEELVEKDFESIAEEF